MTSSITVDNTKELTMIKTEGMSQIKTDQIRNDHKTGTSFICGRNTDNLEKDSRIQTENLEF